MASSSRGTQFVLVEKDGYKKTEMFTAQSLEDMAEFLEQKGGTGGDDERR